MNFDELIERRGTHSMKWDLMESYYNIPSADAIPMWVADMDFRPPVAVSEALKAEWEHGVHGYFGDESNHKAAIMHWMQTQHQWQVEPDWICTTHGLVAAVALCLQAYTQQGDGVILFTPVYHAFARTIKANGREVIESPLINDNGRYQMDLHALAKQLKGHEKMLILCSPHNPSGRVWKVDELQQLADFCTAHKLLLISDEIHHDLVYSHAKHTVMPLAAPSCRQNLVMLTATTKTFNIAGGLTGNAIIENTTLRQRFQAAQQAAGSSPNRFGVLIATAAYQHGAEWLSQLMTYLDQNRQLFDAGMADIEGVYSMPMDATYLAWVDFSATGIAPAEIIQRIQQQAKVVASHGATFGSGGEHFLRFNFACPRSLLLEAIERLQQTLKSG